MTAASRSASRPRRWRTAVILAIAAAVALLLAANAHLVWVSVASQPDCIQHTKLGESSGTGGVFHAAKSAC